jgi:hypothetical protein
MLPIYEAIEVIEIISENVGHTKPWVVLVNTPDGLKYFVTKLYSLEQVDRFHCVTNEIICNVLANQFELKAPVCAFIDIPDELAFRLPMSAQVQLSVADQRLKFATGRIENVKNALPEFPAKYFNKRISMATLYAFDNLIRNCDRGNPKPNLLLNPKDAFLIDHELTFGIENINKNLSDLVLEDKFTKYHLFYPFIKKVREKQSQNLFDEFEFYLNNLNINMLSKYFNQLAVEGFNDYSAPIVNWLNQVKINGSIFVNKLKMSLE